MAGEVGLPQIVHPGALQLGIAPQKTARLDDVERHVQTGPEPDQGSGVLWDVRFIEGEAHGLTLSNYYSN